MSDTQSPDGQDEMLGKLIRYRSMLPPPLPEVTARMTGGMDDTAARDLDDAPEQPSTDDDDDTIHLAPPDWPSLSPEAAADRALGCLLGLALGDAATSSMGQWTARTETALCLSESLLAMGAFDAGDFLIRLQGLAARDSEGLDSETLEALAAYAARDEEIGDDPPPLTGDGGNLSLLRLAPLAICGADDPEALDRLAARQSRATHSRLESVDACRLFISMLTDALSGAGKDAATRPRIMALCPRVLFISAGEWRTKTHDQLRVDSSAVDTLEAALWCVSKTGTAPDAIKVAVRLGEGRHAVAALAGQLAGALYGASSFAKDWPATLEGKARLELLTAELLAQRIQIPQ